VKKRSEPIMVPMACYMVMKLCEGLDYAHNKKDAAGRSLELVHRDVSPQNILISYDGDVKLIDFGIAKAASKSSKTQAGILKGKFGYMSPEQVRGLQVDRRSDVFAVGICLYELLTNERLFVGESDFSTLEKVRNVEIMPPTTYNKRIPDELEAIVLKALAKHPEDRYRSAMDLHDDLQSFMYTSGNFFARKDLSAYVHKIFAEEISRELTRDDEFRKFDSRRANDLEELEGTAVLTAPTPPGGSPKGSPPSPRIGTPPPPPPPPRAPKGTVMGLGGAAQAAQAAVSASARTSVVSSPSPGASRPSAASGMAPASAPPALPPTAQAVAIAAPAEVQEMDWDEEELATQIYDRPEGAKLPSTPPAVPRGTSGARAAASGRTTGVLPALPALPGRNSGVPMPSNVATVSAVGAPPLPSTSLQAVVSPVVGAPPVAAAVSAPAVSAPTPSAVPMPGLPSTPSAPPRPSAAGKDAWRIGDQKFTRPQNDAPPPKPEARRNEGSSVVVLALLGVVAVAALVIIALKLTRGEPSGGLLITTNVGGVAVLVDSQPLVGNGQRFEVPELSVVRLHRVEVRKPGFRPFTQEVPVREAQITQMQVELEPDLASATPSVIPPMPEANPAVAQTALPTPPPMPNPAQTMAINTPPPAPQPVVAPPVPAPVAPRPPRPNVGRPANATRPAVAAATRPVVVPAAAANPPAGGATGVLLISTRPASSCTVAGLGTTFNTPRRQPLPPGTYRVTCANEELAARGTFSVTITAGGTADFRNRPLE
jgi:hypothetical protein